MKISKKIMTSNLMIGFIVTFLLSIMFLLVANNFIRDNAFYNMEKEVIGMVKALEYKELDNLINDNIFMVKRNSKRGITTGHVFIILDENGELMAHSYDKYQDEFEDEFYLELYESSPDQFINLNSGKYPVVTYKKTTSYKSESGEREIQIIGLVYNSLLYKLLFDLMVPVIIALFVVVILSFIISSIYGKKITKPVESLISMTKRISKKEIVNSLIQSGDEFEIISVALEKMSEALNTKDIESKQFYEHVSHDLKTPLTIISGYAEGISNEIFEDNTEPLEKIVKHCNNLKYQIEDVIYLSQLETNRQVFDFRDVVLEEIISEILDDFEVIFIKQDIEVTYFPTKKTTLQLDRDKIIRAMTNIISNASKYTDTELKVEIIELDNFIKVLFSDNGPGFSQEILENPFKGYYDDNGPGNGIGLMIISKIMEAHSSQVNLYNSKKGAVVEVLLKK